jgi:hypothetical protein
MVVRNASTNFPGPATVPNAASHHVGLMYNSHTTPCWSINTLFRMSEVIDIDAEHPTFDAKVWIGQHKIYPSQKLEVPPEVAVERIKILKISAGFQSHLPAPQLSVVDFIKIDLPPLSSALVSTAATATALVTKVFFTVFFNIYIAEPFLSRRQQRHGAKYSQLPPLSTIGF